MVISPVLVLFAWSTGVVEAQITPGSWDVRSDSNQVSVRYEDRYLIVYKTLSGNWEALESGQNTSFSGKQPIAVGTTVADVSKWLSQHNIATDGLELQYFRSKTGIEAIKDVGDLFILAGRELIEEGKEEKNPVLKWLLFVAAAILIGIGIYAKSKH